MEWNEIADIFSASVHWYISFFSHDSAAAAVLHFRLTPEDIELAVESPLNTLSGTRNRRGQLSHRLTVNDSSSADTVAGLASVYCAGFSDDVSRCSCPVTGTNIEIVQVEAIHPQSKRRKNSIYGSAKSPGKPVGVETKQRSRLNELVESLSRYDFSRRR